MSNDISRQMDLWKQYYETKSSAIREKLIIEYSPLVKYVAGRLSIYLGNNVEYEDLLSYGIFGLIDAIDKYDLSKGVKFETYASLRIRGAIIDNIRKLDWVPRSLRQKNKEIERAQAELESKYGRPPTDNEVADYLGMDLDSYSKIVSDLNISHLISLDEFIEQNHDGKDVLYKDDKSDSPASIIEINEIKNTLSDAIDKLPEKEKKVVILYYYEDLTIKEISTIMKVSESRVSQLHSKAIMRLRNKLGRYRGILYEG
ncbi:MAG: FliA/WhiG family RNA polymerase sigma factor [Clostridiaceae bacterium]|nr:FliA/WhiG family RNA polymerase sigma factor [Clostridiaceae bacterium]